MQCNNKEFLVLTSLEITEETIRLPDKTIPMSQFVIVIR